jgi:hypothetical protein
MNIVRVVCANPSCQKVLRIRTSQAGQRIRCPICRVELIAPSVPGAPVPDDEDAEDAQDVPRPAWMNVAFCLGLLAWLFGLVVLAGVFELWSYLTRRSEVKEATTGELLTSGAWKVTGPKGKQAAKAGVEPWRWRDAVWTFHPSGYAETGTLMDDRNRYDRGAPKNYRVWRKWEVEDNKVTMTFRDEEPWTFKVEELPNDKIRLTAENRDDVAPLVLEKVGGVETFPEWRLVFYGGVLIPMLVTILLSWLISREIFDSGCLRFALAWPLTVVLGLALGAGAGFLMDMLNDHSQVVLPHGYVVMPYWMLLSFVQGILGLLMGLWIAVMSCLRPT